MRNPKFKKTILSADHPALAVMDKYERDIAALHEEDKAFHRELHAKHEALNRQARVDMHAAMGTSPADGDWTIDKSHRDVGLTVAVPEEEEEPQEHPLARLLGGLARRKDDEDEPQTPNCGHLH